MQASTHSQGTPSVISFDDQLLTRQEAAAYLRRKPSTLAAWAKPGRGPRFIKLPNGPTLYRRSDLDRYLSTSEVGSTTEASEKKLLTGKPRGRPTRVFRLRPKTAAPDPSRGGR